MAAARADLAQQFGDALDQAALGAEHLLVDIGYLPFADRYADDRLGVIVDGQAQLRIRDRHRAHALRCLFGGRRIMRQQRRGDAALGLGQRRGDERIGTAGDGVVEYLAQRRQGDDHFGAAVDQRGNALDAAAVGRQALGDAIDHVLLFGGKLEPGLLQDFAQRGRGFANLDRLGAGVGVMITASTSRKLPNVSWPIDSENDRVIGEFGGNSEVMLLRPGSKRS